MAHKKLKAPFSAFGGKQRVADLIWARLGDCANVIEPFANSAAFLLARPHLGRIETLNDVDAYIANFWRATQQDPEAVAEYADSPVNEADLHSRHRWLVLSPAAADFRQRMRTDPEYFDARVAGWWCWGACAWIGSGWCATPATAEWEQIPEIGGYSGHPKHGRGVHAKGDLPEKRPILAGAANESGEQGQEPHLKQQRPLLSGGGPKDGTGNRLGIGVHAKGPSEQLPFLTAGGGTGGICYGQGVHAKGPATWEQRPYLGCQEGRHGLGVHQKGPSDGHRPQLADAYGPGRGVHATGPGLSQKRPYIAGTGGGNGVHATGSGLSQQRPHLQGDSGAYGQGVHSSAMTAAGGSPDASLGTCAARRAWLVDWFGRLRDRLRTVRVCCGDWLRVCDSPSVTTRLGLTGIFFDPPYGTLADRQANLYGHDSLTVANDVRAYCLERGSDPLMRLCLAGYAGEGHEELEAHGWEVVAWEATGGYANRSLKGKGKANAAKERLWFSPSCLGIAAREPMPLFDGLEEA